MVNMDEYILLSFISARGQSDSKCCLLIKTIIMQYKIWLVSELSGHLERTSRRHGTFKRN